MKLRGRLVRRWLGILASHWSRRSRREVSLRHRGLNRRSGRALLKLRRLSARGRGLWGRCCTVLKIEILASNKKRIIKILIVIIKFLIFESMTLVRLTSEGSGAGWVL